MPILSLALCCCGLYYLLGPVGPRIAPIIFVLMAPFYLIQKGNIQNLVCLASLRSLIFSERMPPLGTSCFLRVSLHLSLPTQNWLGVIQGDSDGDQGQERMLLLWRSFRTGDAQIPHVRNSENPVRNSENPGRATLKPGKSKLLNSGIPKPQCCTVCQLHCFLNNQTPELKSWSS